MTSARHTGASTRSLSNASSHHTHSYIVLFLALLAISAEAIINMSETCTDTRVQHLRRELKEWERHFALANEGRKATRDEIKAMPEIGMPSARFVTIDGRNC